MKHEQYLFVIAIIPISIALFLFWHTKQEQEHPKELLAQLSQEVRDMQALLDDMGRLEYIQSKNIPRNLLDNGLRKTREASIFLQTVKEFPEHSEMIETAARNFKEIEQTFQWWIGFQSIVQEVSHYDANADLGNLPVQDKGEDIIRRLYLAKGGFSKVRDSLYAIIPLSSHREQLQHTLNSINGILDIIDKTIVATHTQNPEAESLKIHYIGQVQILQEYLRNYSQKVYENVPFHDLEEKLNRIEN